MALTVCICSNEHSVFNQHFRRNGKTGSNADNPQCPSKHPHQLNYLFSREYCSTKFICLAKNECWLFLLCNVFMYLANFVATGLMKMGRKNCHRLEYQYHISHYEPTFKIQSFQGNSCNNLQVYTVLTFSELDLSGPNFIELLSTNICLA